MLNPVILDDRKYIQNQCLAENISKTIEYCLDLLAYEFDLADVILEGAVC